MVKRELTKIKGTRIVELAAKSGIAESTIWRIMSGKKSLSLIDLEKLEACGLIKSPVEEVINEAKASVKLNNGYYHEIKNKELKRLVLKAKKELHPGLNRVLFEEIDRALA